MNRAERIRDFDEYVASRRQYLRKLAYALCHDWYLADDLVQNALIKAYRSWPKIRRAGAEDAFVRQILVRVRIDATRAKWWREHPVAALPDQGVEAEAMRLGTFSDPLIEALAALPEPQRKVVVLRHVVGLDVAECAHELGLSEGTVRSYSSRGLAALRGDLDSARPLPTC